MIVSRLPLPTVQQLSALWAEVSRKPLWLPPNLWRYLRLRSRVRLRELSPHRVRLLAPRGKVNDCQSCMENCCVGKYSTVSLRLRDIATLVDLGRTDLMTHDKPAFSQAELNARPALAQNLASTTLAQFPVLKQNRFFACQALDSEGRCSLFPDWPLSCARFPYALRAQHLEVFYARRCDAFIIHPQGDPRVETMVTAAVAAYNEQIRDQILLAYAPDRLENLGLLAWLARSP